MNKLYKDTKGNIYAVSPIQTPKKQWVALTKKETEAHLNPQQTPEQILAEQIAEAKQYLESTDHKFLVGYVPKDGEDLDAILALRNEKRWFIRANE